MAGDTNNNRMESSSGNTVRHREKVIRSLKKDDSSHLIGLRLYHNQVRPHLGLPDGQTPGEAAGIHIKDVSKWKAIIHSNPRCASKRSGRHHLTEWKVGSTRMFLTTSCGFRHK